MQTAKLVLSVADCCTNLRQELVEATAALNEQIEESAQRMAVKTVEAQMMNKVINTLKEENVEVHRVLDVSRRP